MRRAQLSRRYYKSRSEVKTLIFNKYFYVEKAPVYKLNSGVASKYYFDTRHMMLNWIATREVGMLFRYRILLDAYEEQIEPNDLMIGGLETGAILLTMSIVNRMAITGYYVRKKPKDHGNQKHIVTPRDLNGQNVIIIDDIMTSGESIFKVVSALKMHYPDCKIWKIYTLIDRSREFDFDPFEKYWTDELRDEASFFSVFDSEEDFINLINKDNNNNNIDSRI